MVATLDKSMSLFEVCRCFHADETKLITLIEFMGGLDEAQANRVLYQASIAAATERQLKKFAKTSGKEVNI